MPCSIPSTQSMKCQYDHHVLSTLKRYTSSIYGEIAQNASISMDLESVLQLGPLIATDNLCTASHNGRIMMSGGSSRNLKHETPHHKTTQAISSPLLQPHTHPTLTSSFTKLWLHPSDSDIFFSSSSSSSSSGGVSASNRGGGRDAAGRTQTEKPTPKAAASATPAASPSPAAAVPAATAAIPPYNPFPPRAPKPKAPLRTLEPSLPFIPLIKIKGARAISTTRVPREPTVPRHQLVHSTASAFGAAAWYVGRHTTTVCYCMNKRSI
jgi:hypothetical protein